MISSIFLFPSSSCTKILTLYFLGKFSFSSHFQIIGTQLYILFFQTLNITLFCCYSHEPFISFLIHEKTGGSGGLICHLSNQGPQLWFCELLSCQLSLSFCYFRKLPPLGMNPLQTTFYLCSKGLNCFLNLIPFSIYVSFSIITKT